MSHLHVFCLLTRDVQYSAITKIYVVKWKCLVWFYSEIWCVFVTSAINYDEKDPFLCNACGYCKYAKFDFTVTSRPCCAVDPIENEDDRKKVYLKTKLFLGFSFCTILSIWLCCGCLSLYWWTKKEDSHFQESGQLVDQGGIWLTRFTLEVVSWLPFGTKR